jgi:perosamine synthetase
MHVPGFDLSYSEDDINFISTEFGSILGGGFISMGKYTEAFEKAFASWCGALYAIATSNGTCSIEMILRSIDVKGKTVILPSHTFMATATAVVHAGGRVVFADCMRENFQLDPEDLKRKIRPDTKAVILVHMSGIISPYFNEIKSICDQNGLLLIEDAAHAHGATMDGRMAGTLGIAGSFSFFSTKVLTTGEGGMVVTSDENVYRISKALRDHGRFGPEPNIHDEFGYNWRPSEFHSVLGLRQMQKAADILKERRWIASMYDKLLSERPIPGVKTLKIPGNIKSAYYKYVLYLDEDIDRTALKKTMKEEHGVSLPGELYNKACHTQPVFKKYPEALANPGDSFPETDYVVKNHFCLPLYSGLGEDKIQHVIASLGKAVANLRG